MDGDDCEPLRIPMYGEIIHSPDLEKKLSVADAATFLSKVGVCHWIAQSVSPTTKFTHRTTHGITQRCKFFKVLSELHIVFIP